MTTRNLHRTGWRTFLAGSVFSLVGCVDVVDSENFTPEVEPGMMELGVGMQLPEQEDQEGMEAKAGRMTGPQAKQGSSLVEPLKDVQLFGFQVENLPADESAIVDLSVQTPYLFTRPTVTATKLDADGAAAFSPTTLMPEGVNYFIGYGRTKQKFGAVSNEQPDRVRQEKFKNGDLISPWDRDPDFSVNASRLREFYFGPSLVFEGSLSDGSNKNANRLLCWLNRVLDVKAMVNGEERSLASITEMENPPLATIYTNYIGNVAGSYRSVKSFFNHIYNELIGLQTKAKIPGNAQAPYKPLIDALLARIKEPVAKPEFVAPGLDFAWEDALRFKVVQDADGFWLLKLTNTDLLQGGVPDGEETYSFPEELGLPDGALVLHFLTEEEQAANKHPVFKYFKFESQDKNMSNIGLPTSNYAFPAELIYRVATRIKTSETKQSGKWKPTSVWTDFLGNYTQGGAVQAKTQSVALVEPLRYMVSALVTKARLQSLTLPQGGDGGNLTIKEGFPITGIIVGLQRYVGWNGEQLLIPPAGEPYREFVYYDKELNGTDLKVTDAAFDSFQPLSYTLVMESAKGNVQALRDAVANKETDPQTYREEENKTHQYVLLELLNNQQDFQGHGGQVIHLGNHFYLVGELKLSDQLNKAGVNWDGVTECSIFQQHKLVKANLVITTLAGAYNCVPDLRNPTLSISLKTSFQWQNGVVFDDNIPLDAAQP